MILDCGHVAAEREDLRPGPEFWCSFCAQWRHKADQERITRAKGILADHERGLHDTYEAPDACSYPGCDDSFWFISRLQEHNDTQPEG